MAKENNQNEREEMVACLQFLRTLEQPKATEVVTTATSSDSREVERKTTKKEGDNKKHNGDETQKREQQWNTEKERQRDVWGE